LLETRERKDRKFPKKLKGLKRGLSLGTKSQADFGQENFWTGSKERIWKLAPEIGIGNWESQKGAVPQRRGKRVFFWFGEMG